MEVVQSLSHWFEKPLCLRCIGRGFAKLGTGMTNLERGAVIIDQLGEKPDTQKLEPFLPAEVHSEFQSAVSKLTQIMENIEGDSKSVQNRFSYVSTKNCWLCEGLMGEIDKFAEILGKELSDYEFDNFLVGSKVDNELLAREETMWVSSGLSYPESIKVEINREVGKLLNTNLGKPTEFDNPEIVALIDTRFNVGKISPSPLFIYGRYLKYSRELPQTKWYCRKCRGKGCSHCNHTGKMYETSVEELIAEPFVSASMAEDFSLHGMGREDIDVLMLGNGRPFVLELSRPKKRNFDLEVLTAEINDKNTGKIEVLDLRKSNRGEVIGIKASKTKKTYKCRILAEKPVSNEKLKMVVNTFVERVITQRTPIRVSHRRPDKYRKRIVAAIELVSNSGNELVLNITGESGLYIKELIHGDSARTKPNLSDELGISCNVIELDVIKIHDEKELENGSE